MKSFIEKLASTVLLQFSILKNESGEAILNQELEKYIFELLSEKLLNYYSRIDQNGDKDLLLNRKMEEFDSRGIGLEHLEIQKKFRMVDENKPLVRQPFLKAIESLRSMQSFTIPKDKMSSLIRSMGQINSTIQEYYMGDRNIKQEDLILFVYSFGWGGGEIVCEWVILTLLTFPYLFTNAASISPHLVTEN